MFTTYDLAKLINGIITLVHWAYWGIMLLMLVFCVPAAFKKPQNQSYKILSGIGATLGIIVLFVKVIPFLLILPYKKDIEQKQQKQAAWQRKRQAAEAVFKRECQKAGEKIYRTVDNVEGIMLLKIITNDNISWDRKHHDPMWADAALQSYEDENFIARFLENFDGKGYKYADVLQKNNKGIIRYYNKHIKNNNRQFIKYLNPKNPARYAVTFEDNVDPELRKHWVAGATIQIIDRKTNKIIAEKVTYAFEKGLGGTGGSRMPWAFAISCENQKIYSSNKLPNFVVSVLKPSHLTKETKNVK